MHINNCDDRAGTTSYNIRVIIYIPSNIPSLEMLVFSGTCYAQFKKEYWKFRVQHKYIYKY